MIDFNNYNITEMSYSGYNIVRAYGCDGKLVFGEEPPAPTPTGMTGLKVSGLTDSTSFSKQCEGSGLGANELIPHDVPTDRTILQMEVGTCVNIIGSNAVSEKRSMTELIFPSTILWIRNYSFLEDDDSIQSLIIYATTPPSFQNYIEDEWTDIFGYRYPSSKAPTGFKIYVPSESLNAYKTAEGWNHMADYFVAIQPPLFQGKWLATYAGGTTASADCDATSAITQGEIVGTNLVNIEIGDCVTSIGNRAFYICTGLTSVTIGDGVTIIGDNAFATCESLPSITIPNSVTSIGQYAFSTCSNLTSIDIPSGVTTIGGHAFLDCTGLTSIDIPNSVTSIGQFAFNYCTGLTSVTINNGIIYDSAFSFCDSLRSITIGSGVTSIGNDAFGSCVNITDITVNSITPPILDGWVFDDTSYYPIYVPAESVNAYKEADGWSDYASRIQAIQT